MRCLVALCGLIVPLVAALSSADETANGPTEATLLPTFRPPAVAAQLPNPAPAPALAPQATQMLLPTARGDAPVFAAPYVAALPAGPLGSRPLQTAAAAAPLAPATRLELLRAALEKLEAAGAKAAADGVREEIAREEQSAMHQLDKKLTELATLQAEIGRLRRETGTVQQVLLKLKVLDIDVTKLRNAGFSFRVPDADPAKKSDFQEQVEKMMAETKGEPESATQGLGTLGPLSPNHPFHEFLDMLERQELLTVLCEPNLVAYSGQPASFLSGGQFPLPTGPDANSVTMKSYGTMVDFTPQVQADGRVQLDIRACLSAIDMSRATKIGHINVPGLQLSEINTRVVMRFGETLVCSSLVEKRAIDAPSGVYPAKAEGEANKHLFHRLFLVTPQLIEALPASPPPLTAEAPQALRR